MQPWAVAALGARRAEVEEARARLPPALFERAHDAWAALGYVNDFRQVAAYYQRLHELEATLTPEARATSQAADARLRSGPPPTSGCLRRLYPHLYPQHWVAHPAHVPAHAAAHHAPTITEGEAAAHPDVRRHVRRRGLTVKALLVEFRTYAAREHRAPTYYHLLCYVNQHRESHAEGPVAPRTAHPQGSESETTTANSQLDVAFVTSQAVSVTTQELQCTLSALPNGTASSSTSQTLKGESVTSLQMEKTKQVASNSVAGTKPSTSREISQLELTPPAIRESEASTPTNSKMISVNATSNLKPVLHVRIFSEESSNTFVNTPPAISDTKDLKNTTIMSVNRVSVMPECSKEVLPAKSEQATNAFAASRFTASTPVSPRRASNVAVFSRYNKDVERTDFKSIGGTPFNPPRPPGTPIDPHTFGSLVSYRSSHPMNSIHSLYKTAMLGGLPYDMNNLMSPQQRSNTSVSPRSACNTSGSSYSSFDVTKSPVSPPSSRSKLNSFHSPRRAAPSARRSLDSSLSRAAHQDARTAGTKASPPRPPDAFDDAHCYRQTSKKLPHKTYSRVADRGRKKVYTKPWRDECSGGGYVRAENGKDAKSTGRGKVDVAAAGSEGGDGGEGGEAGGDGESGDAGEYADAHRVSGDTDAGAGRAAGGDVAEQTRGAARRSSHVGSNSVIVDRFDKLSLVAASKSSS